MLKLSIHDRDVLMYALSTPHMYLLLFYLEMSTAENLIPVLEILLWTICAHEFIYEDSAIYNCKKENTSNSSQQGVG